MSAQVTSQHSFGYRLKSEIDFEYRKKFLYHTNKTPSVSVDLKQLTHTCQAIFGKCPFRHGMKGAENAVFDNPLLSADRNVRGDWLKIWLIATGFSSRLWRKDRNWIQSVGSVFKKGSLDEFQLLEPKIEEFYLKFDNLLRSHYWDVEWLKPLVFLAIWTGSGRILIPNTPVEIVEEKISEEIRSASYTSTSMSGAATSDWICEPGIPLHAPFVFSKAPSLHEPLSKYAERAVQAYRSHLDRYFEVIQSALERNGYVRTSGAKSKFDYVELLVKWNESRLCKSEWLEELDVSPGVNRYIDENTIFKAFGRLREHGLPRRPAPRMRRKKK